MKFIWNSLWTLPSLFYNPKYAPGLKHTTSFWRAYVANTGSCIYFTVSMLLYCTHDIFVIIIFIFLGHGKNRNYYTNTRNYYRRYDGFFLRPSRCEMCLGNIFSLARSRIIRGTKKILKNVQHNDCKDARTSRIVYEHNVCVSYVHQIGRVFFTGNNFYTYTHVK